MVMVGLVHFTGVFFPIPPFIELMVCITSGFGGYYLGRKKLEISFELQPKCFNIQSETRVFEILALLKIRGFLNFKRIALHIKSKFWR